MVLDKNIIVAARNQVLQGDDNIAKIIKDVRGESMGDHEVHEHVEKAIAEATRNRILEAVSDDDPDWDLDGWDLDDDDFGSGDGDGDGDANYDFDGDGEEAGSGAGSGADGELEGDDFEDSIIDPEAIKAEVGASTASGSSAAAGLIRSIGHFFEVGRVDYLDTIDALYKKSIDTGTHRDTYNLLTFVKFIGCTDLTAAFAFLDIPNTDLSEVFSHLAMSEGRYCVVDGIFYKSTFNNDSILAWPWRNLYPTTDAFRGCPYSNLQVNKIAGRKVLKLPGIDKAREDEISTFSSKAIEAIRKANTPEE
jgi:hypothetical protein